MKRIAVISDTHGMLREKVKEELRVADVIIHAGDVHTEKLLQELRTYGTLYVVRGNNDRWQENDLPEVANVYIEGIHFLIAHDQKDIPTNIRDVGVIIYGHSHKYHAEVKDGKLWLNPGSCGARRFGRPATMCRIYVDDGSCEYHVIGV